MPLSSIDPGVLSALQAGNDSLRGALTEGYKNLGIDQNSPIVNGATNSGTSVSQKIADAFNKDLAGGFLSQSSDKNSTDLLDQIFNPFGMYNKIVPKGAETSSAGPDLSVFSYGRIVVIVLGFVLIGGGILLFAGEDIIGAVKKAPELLAAV